MQLAQATRVDLLREEYFKLQDTIEAFDERALQIKGWSVTVSLAGMAAAIVSSIPSQSKALAFLIASVGAIAFWVIEYFWKSFQWSLMNRIDAIEAAFREGKFAQESPLQIRTCFRAHFKKNIWPDLHKALKPSLMLPHVLIAILGASLAVAFWARS